VATVWAAAAVAVLLALAMFGVDLGAAASLRHRAEAAADLAALAAAGHATGGERVACAYAARVAEGMSTRLRSCRLTGWEAFVEMVADGPIAPLPNGTVSARAHAGPAE
jgi:secretion/DNA translocation related TadE-like protein